jgi:hypothetical protein
MDGRATYMERTSQEDSLASSLAVLAAEVRAGGGGRGLHCMIMDRIKGSRANTKSCLATHMFQSPRHGPSSPPQNPAAEV